MVYLFLADGFEEIEALGCVDILRRAGVDVKTVGVTGKTVAGAHGINVEADMRVTECGRDAEMVILPGGSVGTDNLASSDDVARIVTDAAERNAYVAAICAAPTVLGKLGLLEGRRAVCYPGLEGRLTGAAKSSDRVCVDGNYITSRGPGTTAEFSLTIVELLKGRKTADAIREGMLW
ncbi:MAG: DJ-1/PfpI family protein [Clostridia bacterium]|nr:DJ-1/PfpI family protein [Clostridia bacterium]